VAQSTVATTAIRGHLWVSHRMLIVAAGRAVLETGHKTQPRRCVQVRTLTEVRSASWCLLLPGTCFVVDLAMFLCLWCSTAIVLPFAEMVSRCNAVSSKHHQQQEISSLFASLHTGVCACCQLLSLYFDALAAITRSCVRTVCMGLLCTGCLVGHALRWVCKPHLRFRPWQGQARRWALQTVY
jgi:hypothetical protein